MPIAKPTVSKNTPDTVGPINAPSEHAEKYSPIMNPSQLTGKPARLNYTKLKMSVGLIKSIRAGYLHRYINRMQVRGKVSRRHAEIS